ncbi:helix-turn-helix domain-containing protein [Vagococcus fluvialis]|uniref:Helix-turn-helix domain-containing protein n=1 Tax=Vagococcus fluvialis TaxID=2738 RepID=A0A7X6D9Z5_9ENTE|nr:helix-turn-helix domain-containing protein [Vagococcus fluvialis]NKC68532.1 helix-turn-helix domain-containing protein [Vagococcus fluvialis]
MVIGLINSNNMDQELKEIGKCDFTILLTPDITKKWFYLMIESNIDHEIVSVERDSIPLQLLQMLPALELLRRKNRCLKFVKRKCSSSLTDEEYQNLLCDLANSERKIIANRSKLIVKDNKRKGITVGRPKISEETIEKIYKLYSDKRTIRYIAEQCNVSIGTVHKYIKKKI